MSSAASRDASTVLPSQYVTNATKLPNISSTPPASASCALSANASTVPPSPPAPSVMKPTSISSTPPIASVNLVPLRDVRTAPPSQAAMNATKLPNTS